MNILEKQTKSKEQVIDIIKYLKFKKQNAMRFCNSKEATDCAHSIERLVKTVSNLDKMLSELSNA